MPTNRTPRGRPPTSRITPAAVEAFKRMQAARDGCTCSPDGWAIGGDCPACDEWWQQHSILHHELHLRLWHWPAYEHPDAGPPFPEGSPAAQSWKPDLDGQARYRALEQAAAKS